MNEPRGASFLARLETPLAAFLVSRILAALAASVGLTLWPVTLTPELWSAFPDAPWIDGFVRFDAGWYWSIVDRGYEFVPGVQSNVNFFPLFSLLAAILSAPLLLLTSPERAFFLAGMALSLGAFYLGLRGLFELTAARLGRDSAIRAVWLVALFPFSLYFAAPMSEGLFFGLAVWAFWSAHRQRWALACALAALCAVTRIPGFLVAVGLFVEYLRQHGYRPGRLRRDVLWFGITPLPVVGLLTYFWIRFDNPLVFRDTQIEAWGRVPGLTHVKHGWAVVSGSAPAEPAYWIVTVWVMAIITGGAALAAMAWRRLGAGYALFAAVALASAAFTGLPGVGRYSSVLFPLFMVAATLARGRLVFGVVLGLFAVFLVLFTYFFAHWNPIVS